MGLVWSVVVAALVAVLVLAGAFVLVGPARVWTAVAGPPDMGPVDFRTLVRPSTPNTYLVCPEGLCATAQPDATADPLPVPAERLAASAIAALSALPRAERVDDRTDPLRARFVVRTPLMGFPDTVAVEAVPLGPDRSALAVYSRSQLGHSDLGANGRRVRGLLATVRGELTERP